MIFIYLMTINVPLAMISLIPLGITLIIMVGCFAFMAGMMPHVTEAMANFNSVIIEYINGMKLIKAYNMSRHSFKNSPVRLKKKIVSGIKYHERQVHSMRHLLLFLNVEWH